MILFLNLLFMPVWVGRLFVPLLAQSAVTAEAGS